MRCNELYYDIIVAQIVPVQFIADMCKSTVILVLLVILLRCTSAVLCGANSTREVHNSVMSKVLSRKPPELWNGITDNHDNDDDNQHRNDDDDKH